MKTPLLTRLRRFLRTILSYVLSFFIKSNEVEQFIDKKEIKKIIIVRPNYRIGNLIFLTPFINELHKHLPDAKIDIIVGLRLAGNVLEPLPNVSSIIDIPRKLLKNPLKLYQFIKRTRKTEYDLAINITSNSISSQIVTGLVKSHYKVSMKSHKQIFKLTHAVVPQMIYDHSALQILEFLDLFKIPLPLKDVYLDIKLTQEEIHRGEQELQTLLSSHNLSINNKTIALFRNARFDKKIADEWWNEWYTELMVLDNSIIVIDILSPDILAKLNKNFLEYSNKNLRNLGAFFRACNAYISADTGPMHLASASKANTLAFFNKGNPKAYGTLGKNDKTVDIHALTPKETAKITYDFLHAQSQGTINEQ